MGTRKSYILAFRSTITFKTLKCNKQIALHILFLTCYASSLFSLNCNKYNILYDSYSFYNINL